MLTLENFVGNSDLRKLLKISIVAARKTNAALPHVLLKGPAGTGKTSLAEVIAKEFGTSPIALTPNTAKKPELLRQLFLRLPGDGYNERGEIVGKIKPQIVFSDECHQLPLVAQENLGIAMQDWRLPVRVNGKDVFEWVPRFTLIGATTLPGKLSKPFLDRFKIQSEFETYSLEESMEIVGIHAKKMGLTLGEGVSESIAKRSRGVARLIVRFLERISDAAIVASVSNPTYRTSVTQGLAEAVFRDFLKIDDRGLTRTDIKVLKQLWRAHEPVGLEYVAAAANEDKATIEKSIEPYLIEEGLIIRTKRGRILTDEGRRYLESEGYITPSGEGMASTRLIGAE